MLVVVSINLERKELIAISQRYGLMHPASNAECQEWIRDLVTSTLEVFTLELLDAEAQEAAQIRQEREGN